MNKPEELLFLDIEKPVPQRGEVLIKVKRVGICGSDIHAYYGKHPTVYLPVVQGHEFSGTVEAVGEGVEGFEAGEPVTVRPQYTCGECFHCASGHENICHNLMVLGCNGKVPGGAQDYIAVKDGLVFKLPENMDCDDGAMVEPTAVGVAAVKSFTEGVEGKNILVLGAGTIGNLTAQAAKGFGAKVVMITDLCDEKLEVARECGVDYTVNTAKEDLEQSVIKAFGIDGLDGALECVGVEQTINDAIKVCRKRNEIIIVGVYGGRPAIDMINVQEKELKLIGTLMYLEDDYRDAIRLISEGRIRLNPLKTRHFKLEEYGEAYDYIAKNKEISMKVLIDVDE